MDWVTKGICCCCKGSRHHYGEPLYLCEWHFPWEDHLKQAGVSMGMLCMDCMVINWAIELDPGTEFIYEDSLSE